MPRREQVILQWTKAGPSVSLEIPLMNNRVLGNGAELCSNGHISFTAELLRITKIIITHGTITSGDLKTDFLIDSITLYIQEMLFPPSDPCIFNILHSSPLPQSSSNSVLLKNKKKEGIMNLLDFNVAIVFKLIYYPYE